MSEPEREPRRPTPDQPLNAPERSSLAPLVVTVLILALVALVFFTIFVVMGSTASL